jgi:hypothetical protein
MNNQTLLDKRELFLLCSYYEQEKNTILESITHSVRMQLMHMIHNNTNVSKLYLHEFKVVLLKKQHTSIPVEQLDSLLMKYKFFVHYYRTNNKYVFTCIQRDIKNQIQSIRLFKQQLHFKDLILIDHHLWNLHFVTQLLQRNQHHHQQHHQ